MYKLIAEAIACALLVAAVMFAVHKYNEHFRDEGRAEVQKVFDAYKVAQDKQRTEIINDYVSRIKVLEDEKAKNDLASVAREAILESAVGKVVNTTRGVIVTNELARVFDAATATANGRLAAPDAGKQTDAKTVPPAATGTSTVYDERELAEYIKNGSEAYDDAVGLLLYCRGERDACRDAKAKQVSH